MHGAASAVNPERTGTKAAAHYAAHGRGRASRGRSGSGSATWRRRARAAAPFGRDFDDVDAARRTEADEFYAAVIPVALTGRRANVMRQALAGMLWTKQFYYYDVDTWLGEHGADPFKPARRARRATTDWHHMHNADIISMPDKWEYPWYAAWDLAFHILALTLVDEDFAKHQLELMLREHYLHPNGQMPAYEWNFGDVNPPVHAWATIFTLPAREGAGGARATSMARARVPQADCSTSPGG